MKNLQSPRVRKNSAWNDRTGGLEKAAKSGYLFSSKTS